MRGAPLPCCSQQSLTSSKDKKRNQTQTSGASDGKRVGKGFHAASPHHRRLRKTARLDESKGKGETNWPTTQTRTSGGSQAQRVVSRQSATGFRPGASGEATAGAPATEARCPCRLGRSERSPSCPNLHTSSSSIQPSLSPPASQPRPGTSLAARSQLSLLWGAPSYRGRRLRHRRGRGVPAGPGGARGAGVAAEHAPGLPPKPPMRRYPDPAQPPSNSPRVSALTPKRPWFHKPPREKGTKGTQAALPPLPEGRTRRRGDHHRRPAGPLPGHRGHRRRATDTNN